MQWDNAISVQYQAVKNWAWFEEFKCFKSWSFQKMSITQKFFQWKSFPEMFRWWKFESQWLWKSLDPSLVEKLYNKIFLNLFTYSEFFIGIYLEIVPTMNNTMPDCCDIKFAIFMKNILKNLVKYRFMIIFLAYVNGGFGLIPFCTG